MNLSEKLINFINESNEDGYTAVDLDGTLAFYDKFRGNDHIGDPIPEMVKKVKDLLNQGKQVKIMTARVHSSNEDVESIKKVIQDWCKKHLGEVLPVTCEKDSKMIELWDDRAKQVIKNTGKFIEEK
jgi:hypothetical protein